MDVEVGPADLLPSSHEGLVEVLCSEPPLVPVKTGAVGSQAT